MQLNFRTKLINERTHRIRNYKNLKMMVLGHHFVIQHCYLNLGSVSRIRTERNRKSRESRSFPSHTVSCFVISRPLLGFCLGPCKEIRILKAGSWQFSFYFILFYYLQGSELQPIKLEKGR